MLHHYISEYSLIAIGAMLLVLVVIKAYLIAQTGIREGKSSILLSSFAIYSKNSIRNTFHDKLKKYYKSSNSLNMWFYLLVGVLLLAYFFVRAIAVKV